MKTYKVIFTVFTALILGGFVLAGCSNEESGTYDNLKQRPVNSYELSKDSNFIIIANEVYDFNDFLTSKIQEKALIIEDINIELTNIQELSYEEQLVKIDEIFKVMCPKD